MATTKIWTVKTGFKELVEYAGNPEKTVIDDDLWTVLHYAVGAKKTRYDETRAFVHGVACSDEHPYEDMMAVKKHFGKTGGNLAYHAYQSFKPGEVTPQECHEIGMELARRLWGKRFQVLVATHMDRSHLHNHFVINSVSYVDGKKFDCSERTYYELRHVSDEICRQRQLSVIEKPKGHTPRTIYFAEKAGEPTRYNLMREAIDRAASMSKTWKEFDAALLKLGYVLETSSSRKYPTIRSVHGRKATRLYHLGEEYLPENIEKIMRLNYPNVRYQWDDFMYPRKGQEAPKTEHRTYRMKGSFKSAKRDSGVRAVFLIFGHLLGVYPVNRPEQRRRPLSPELRQALRFLDRITEETHLIAKYGLHTDADIAAFITAAEGQIDESVHTRRKLYDRVSRADTEDEKNIIRAEYAGLTDQISVLRRELRTAHRIVDDLPKMKEDIAAEQEMRSLHRAIEERSHRKTRERSHER